MSIVFTLGVFNLPRLTYHPKVNGLSFYGCNWKTFQAIVTILMSLDCQQRSFDVAYKSCPIFNSEVQLCQKHCSLALDCAMVLRNAQKTRFLCDFRSHPLAGDNNTNGCTYHATLIWNPIHMDFQWDQIHLQAELLVLNLPHGPG